MVCCFFVCWLFGACMCEHRQALIFPQASTLPPLWKKNKYSKPPRDPREYALSNIIDKVENCWRKRENPYCMHTEQLFWLYMIFFLLFKLNRFWWHWADIQMHWNVAASESNYFSFSVSHHFSFHVDDFNQNQCSQAAVWITEEEEENNKTTSSVDYGGTTRERKKVAYGVCMVYLRLMTITDERRKTSNKQSIVEWMNIETWCVVPCTNLNHCERELSEIY